MRRPPPIDGMRIGIVGKGGAGKSTLTALLAGCLQRRGHAVLVLDGDSTNMGLGEALAVAAPEPLIRLFGDTVFRGGKVSCPVDDPTPLAGSQRLLSDIPPGFYSVSADGIVYMVAGKAGRDGPGSGCDGPAAKIVRDLRVLAGDQEMLTLVDFKAGLEEVARGAIVTLDRLLAVIDPTRASLQLAFDLAEALRRLKAGVRPETRHLARPDLVATADRFFAQPRLADLQLVLNRVRDAATEATMRSGLSARQLAPLAVIPEDPGVGRGWLEGRPLWSSVSPRVINVVTELAEWLGRAPAARVPALSVSAR